MCSQDDSISHSATLDTHFDVVRNNRLVLLQVMLHMARAAVHALCDLLLTVIYYEEYEHLQHVLYLCECNKRPL